MRNLIIAVAAIALAAVAYFAFAGRADQPAPAPVAPTTAETTTAAPDVTEARADEATAATTAAPAETVEESSGSEEPGDRDERLLLAQATPAVKTVSSRFKSGVHYRELVPAQPRITNGDKIEVVEVFWYGCNHCYTFDPIINRWDAGKADDVEFVRMPVIWNNTQEKHARAFYIAEILAANGKLDDPGAVHDAFFEEIQVKRQLLTTDRALLAFFARFGVSADDYEAVTAGQFAFELDGKVRTAKDLTGRYDIKGVPAIVVNGRYANKSQGLASYDEYLELVDALVDSER